MGHVKRYTGIHTRDIVASGSVTAPTELCPQSYTAKTLIVPNVSCITQHGGSTLVQPPLLGEQKHLQIYLLIMASGCREMQFIRIKYVEPWVVSDGSADVQLICRSKFSQLCVRVPRWSKIYYYTLRSTCFTLSFDSCVCFWLYLLIKVFIDNGLARLAHQEHKMPMRGPSRWGRLHTVQ